MKQTVCPPDASLKKGFYPLRVYRKCLAMYPSINDLVRKKASEYGNKIWLIFTDGRKYSYSEIDTISGKIGKGLSAIGVRKGEAVAIYAYNSPEWIFAYLGILKAGAIPVTVNTGFIGDPLIYNLKKTDTKYLFLDRRLADNFIKVNDKLDNVSTIITIGEVIQKLNKNTLSYEDLVKKSNNETVSADLKWDDPAAMILTSGTTGPSKVVVETNAQFIATALVMADAGGVNEKSINYVYLPLFHIMALDLATISSMLTGSTMVLTERFNPGVFWEHVKDYNVTHFHAVGPILEMLLKQPSKEIEKSHGPLIAIAYCSKEIWNEAVKRFNLKITGGYGGTEAGIPVTSPYSVVNNMENPPGSCGKPAPPFEVKLMDKTGNIVSRGEGEILIRPKLPYVTFLEYYNMPESTVKAFRGLWFHTGDLGRIGKDGYLYFVDRLKDSIRRKGENISSYEVEQVLLSSDQIKDAAIFPVRSGSNDEDVMAAIVPSSSDVTPESIIDFCIEHMPSFWIPSYIRIMKELPKTPTGRTEKYKLKEEGITSDTHNMHEYISRILHRDSHSIN